MAQINGTNGADLLQGGIDSDIIHGLAGNDFISGGAGIDWLYGDDGDDGIDYRSEDAVTDGGNGIDTLQADDASGVTIVNLGNAADQVTGGGVTTNFENVNFQWMTIGASITGSAGSNLLIGTCGADTINGGDGSDTIYGHLGNDNIYYDANDALTDGGADSDTLMLIGAGSYQVNLANADQVVGGGSTSNFENVDAVSASGAQTITGSSGDNFLRGGLGADTVHGGDGNDIVIGQEGADSLYGDGGDDSIDYRSEDLITDGGTGNDILTVGDAAVSAIDLSNGADQVSGGGTTTGFERVDANWMSTAVTIHGSASDNGMLRGGAGDDYIYGGAGNDVVVGQGGSDHLYGEDGDDSIDYRSEDAVTDGGNGIDTLTVGEAGVSTIDLSNGADQVTGGGTTTNFENVNASWMTTGMTVTGNAGANVLTGGSGNDTLTGGDGNDTLIGGAGKDYLWGGAGNDVLSSEAGLRDSTSNSASSLWGQGGVDTLIGGAGKDAFCFNHGDVAAGTTEVVSNFEVFHYGTNLSDYLAGTANFTTRQVYSYDSHGEIAHALLQVDSDGYLDVSYINYYA